MQYRDLIAIFGLLSTWGIRYGFIECDFAIRTRLSGSRSLEVELGWGRLLVDRASGASSGELSVPNLNDKTSQE